MYADAYMKSIEKSFKATNLHLPPIVGFTGQAGVGKDSAALYLSRQYKYEQLSFAAPIKAMLNAGFGIDPAVWEDRVAKERVIDWIGRSPRQLAQTLGTEWGRNCVAQTIWLSIFSRNAAAVTAEGKRVVVSDVRYANEAQHIVNMGGVIIRIERPDVAPVATHASEYGIPTNLVSGVIVNDYNLDTLYTRVERLVLDLGANQEARRRALRDNG